MFTYVYNCLLVHVYLCLNLFTRVYVCLPLFTPEHNHSVSKVFLLLVPYCDIVIGIISSYAKAASSEY